MLLGNSERGRWRIKTLLTRLLVFTAITVLAGCANLGGLQSFGKLSSDVAAYSKLTDDYAVGPKDNQQYTLSSETQQRQLLAQQAELRAKQVARLRLLQTTLSEYMAAIAALAGEEAVNFDAEIGSLADNAQSAEVISVKDASAVKSIAGIIATALADFYRQKKLTDVIEKADPHVQTVVASIRGTIALYQESLEVDKQRARGHLMWLEELARTERIALEEVRLLARREHVPSGPAWAKLPSLKAEEIWSERLRVEKGFDEKLKAVKSYDGAMEKIAKAHSDLFTNRTKLGDTEVQRQISQYVKKISAAYKASKGEGEATPADDKKTAAAQ